MTDKDALLTMNGASYKLALILQNARTCPAITVKADELNDSAQPDFRVETQPAGAADDAQHIVVVKQAGKYTVVTGRNKVTLALAENKLIDARIMSTVALKKAKIDTTSSAANDETDRREAERRQEERRLNQRPEYANQRDPDNGYSRYSYARGVRSRGNGSRY
jgi:hypothetical protein